MQQLQINKTWNDRMTGGVINHFFENMWLGNKTDHQTWDFHRFMPDGTIAYVGDRGTVANRYHNTEMVWYLASKEALEEVDNLNTILFNQTVKGAVPTNSIYYEKGARYDHALVNAIWEDNTIDNHFGKFINTNIVGKENAYWKPILGLSYANLIVTPNNSTNTCNVKYKMPFQLVEHFNQADYTAGGNTDLYLVIPYVRYDGIKAIEVFNPTSGFSTYMSSYIALKITDVNGDGDIKFDHIDDIDYIDKLEFTLKTPHLI